MTRTRAAEPTAGGIAEMEGASDAERHMLAVRDGVRLETLVFLPENGSGPFQVLYARCVYGTERERERAGRYLREGYAVVLQNVRGRGASEGAPPGTNRKPWDSWDTMEWLTAQGWCDGQVGTFGGSALAAAQVAAAFLGHPAHRAMCPAVLPFGRERHLGGTVLLTQLPMWLYGAQSGSELRPHAEVDWMRHLAKLPVVSLMDELGPAARVYRSVMADRYRSYFDEAGPEAFDRLRTPGLLVTGWYDHCLTGPLDYFDRVGRWASDLVKDNTHLVIGPWDHELNPASIDAYDFGPHAGRDHLSAEVSFFDRHVRERTSAPPTPPVRIFVMGRNQWRDEESWPLARSIETRLFLRASGRLSGDAPAEEGPDCFVYDPADPVPTIGGANPAPARFLPMKRGPRDQRPTLSRDDVLLYLGDPLAEPLEVTGWVRMVLFASSSARDTDFTAKLMDVRPDGDARILCDGAVRARFRNGLDTPEFINPGEVYRYEIDLWATSNEFGTGHRIGLAISSSNFPRLSRNLNTGGDSEQEARFAAARQTIFHEGQRPSHLVLPVVPAS